jgi:hypothetical protein
MKRDYKDGVQEGITFFVGREIERTPAFGMQTLFVVGIQDADSIMDVALANECTHIYFGANQSFKTKGVNDAEGWRPWEDMIKKCLDAGYWCTLDLDVCEHEGLLESGLTENRRFIPQISVKLPYLTQLGYNATIKLDDLDFDATNPGVWCHRLRDLTTTESFTDWDQYGKDEIIK